MLVKTSILSRKGAAAFFGCFMVIATILVFVSAGAVMPLKNNIDQNINNHILNRELNFEISENTPQNESYIINKDSINKILENFKK